MNLDKIKQKLQNLESAKGGGGKHKWTPTVGTHVVRMVPYLHNKEWPFQELFFYYKLKKGTVLSPITFDKPDPVQEFVEQLKSTGDKEDWKTAVNIQAKSRIYIPVLVRGKEEEGVKFWGFGKQIYQELLKVIDDPDYGDISHPKTGRDITIEVVKTDKPWHDTVIRMKPNSTPMTTSKDVLELIKEMPDINTLWPEPTYDELKVMLSNYLDNVEEEGADKEVSKAPGKSSSDDPFDTELTDEDLPFMETKTTTTAKKTSIKEAVNPSLSSVDADFDDLFNN